MTGIFAGSGGTGLIEGSRPGTGVSGITAYDRAVLATGPVVYFDDMTIGPVIPPPTYEELIAASAPAVHFDDMTIGPVIPPETYAEVMARLAPTIYFADMDLY